MFHSHSLRTRFALIIAVLVFSLSWLLGSIIEHDASKRIEQRVGQNLGELANTMVERLDIDMQTRASILTVISHLEVLKRPDDIDQVRVLVDELKINFPRIAWIGFTDANGQVLASSNRVLEGANISQRPVYQEALKGVFIGDVHEAVLLAKLLPNPTGEAMKFVDISIPVRNDDGALAGVLAAHLSWEWANEVRLAILEPIQKNRHVEFFILSKDGTVLLGPQDMIGQPLALSGMKTPDQTQPQWFTQRWPDGQEYLTGVATSKGYRNYEGLGWTVVARQPLNQAYEPAYAMTRNILLWGSLLAILFALLGWFLAGYFTRPLRRIARAADRLSAGKVSVIPDLKGTSEIVRLSQSIRHLVESLRLQQSALGAMQNLAHHDALTGLPNRIALEGYLARAQQLCHTHQNSLVVFYLDLDGFKPVNDQYGHAAGDQLLKEVALRLRSCLREGDLVARLGGDEFLMVLQVTANSAQEQAQMVATRTLQVLGQEIQLDGCTVQIGCSIGAAIWPADNQQLDATLELADKALYRAKKAGRNRVVFHSDQPD
ncbi:sensor domain-containing diguanylate cyclase [Pseudomonas sp. TTU2014-080ASC]|uniref:sensor domain-containing diguanylate cyclase n=1 Tax=Pseudomonas sp. TTU2014-080ASC TaxID=1729724 RepID=UPI0007184AC9|nr:sensor domain-containing diguanylate cyclase [Pseudomonas sp. TTU2014-080ASC]KRW59329.1 diguanylate cyclase [Pseudomonas sp. TTU2014-080ASC]